MVYSKRRKNLGLNGRKKRSNRKLNRSNRFRKSIMKGGSWDLNEIVRKIYPISYISLLGVINSVIGSNISRLIDKNENRSCDNHDCQVNIIANYIRANSNDTVNTKLNMEFESNEYRQSPLNVDEKIGILKILCPTYVPHEKKTEETDENYLHFEFIKFEDELKSKRDDSPKSWWNNYDAFKHIPREKHKLDGI